MGQNEEGSLRNKSKNILLSTIFFQKHFFYLLCLVAYGDKCRGPQC